jgi:hypothetical protein
MWPTWLFIPLALFATDPTVGHGGGVKRVERVERVAKSMALLLPFLPYRRAGGLVPPVVVRYIPDGPAI